MPKNKILYPIKRKYVKRIFDGTKENKATLHAISEDELKAIGIDMDNLSASVPE